MLTMTLIAEGPFLDQDADERIMSAHEAGVAAFVEALAAGIRTDVGIAMDREPGAAGLVRATPTVVGDRGEITVATDGAGPLPETQLRKPGLGVVLPDGTVGTPAPMSLGQLAKQRELEAAAFESRFAAMVEDALDYNTDAAMAAYEAAFTGAM